LLGHGGREAPTLLGSSEAGSNAIYTFESVLGLACQPDPAALGLANKAKPNSLTGPTLMGLARRRSQG